MGIGVTNWCFSLCGRLYTNLKLNIVIIVWCSV